MFVIDTEGSPHMKQHARRKATTTTKTASTIAMTTTTHHSPNGSKVDPQKDQRNNKQQTNKNNKQCSSDTLLMWLNHTTISSASTDLLHSKWNEACTGRPRHIISPVVRAWSMLRIATARLPVGLVPRWRRWRSCLQVGPRLFAEPLNLF